MRRTKPRHQATYYHGHPWWYRTKKWGRRLVIGSLVCGIAGGVALKVTLKGTPKLSTERLTSHSARVLTIKASNGPVIYTSNAMPYRAATAKQIAHATNLKNALLSIEDRNFYHEGGVNFQRTAKTLVADVLYRERAGGSTLSQQLIKMTYFNNQPRSIHLKIQEGYLAYQLDKRYSKNQILRFYMNKVYLGNNIYGMQTAAKYYFNKNIDELTVNQAALLAGMVQAPSCYEPYHHYDTATLRRNKVLAAMYANHKLSKDAYYRDNQQPLRDDYVTQQRNFEAQNQQIQMTKSMGDYMTGMWAYLKKHPEHSNVITASVNTDVQHNLENIVNNDGYFPNSKMQCAIAITDNKTGQVVAEVGGRHQQPGDFDRASQMARSSGSSIKPILDYAPAMDLLHWGSGTEIWDSPYKYADGTPVFDWDHKWMNGMCAANALYLSRNIPAIKALTAVGINRAQQYLKPLGLPKNLVQSSALGVNTNPVQIGGWYSALANMGMYEKPTYVMSTQPSIHSKDVTKIANPKTKVFSPQAAFMLNQSLVEVPTNNGLNPAAHIDGGIYAGKSGTVGDDIRTTDEWYVGYCKQYTVAVWIGFDNPNNNKLPSNAGLIVDYLYKDTMQMVIKTIPGADTSNWNNPGKLKKLNNAWIWQNGGVDRAN